MNCYPLVHCAHMLSRDGNRSGLRRQTPDKDWNQRLLNSIPGGCCQFKSFGKLANYHTGMRVSELS